MKKQKISLIIIVILSLLVILCTNNISLASSEVEKVQCTEQYKEWLKLSDKDKQKIMEPRKYEIPISHSTSKNPILKAKLLKSSVSSKYSLKDIIPENLKIRDQQQTEICWSFAALSSLETNLAMRDRQNNNSIKVYDYSERHMAYSTRIKFLNDKINEMGYGKNGEEDEERNGAGNWGMASSYLTNGSGAVDESDMPFENNYDLIDISQLDKNVKTQVYDTIEFPDYNKNKTEEERGRIINEIKEHIQNRGAVFGSIQTGFAGILNYVSDTTGAVAVGSMWADHAISVIGWDDDYSVDNFQEFSENSRPKSNGAWITRNSWGEGYGDNGLIYISYEDKNFSASVNGIINASDNIDYENIYQYDIYYSMDNIYTSKKFALCNIFNKKQAEKDEYITQVSIYAPCKYTCKVYLNPNGDSKNINDLQAVGLKTGETETFEAGYHTLEFLKPVKINSDRFAVVIEVECEDGIDNNQVKLLVERDIYPKHEFPEGCSFILKNYGNNNLWDSHEWNDLSDYYSDAKSVSTIKAFTTSEYYDNSLKNIQITTPPSKIAYFEGENFDKTGMIVKATYNRKNNPTVTLSNTDYSITNGNDLKVGQTSVTITYGDKSISQNITVLKNDVKELKITTAPIKIEYKEGQKFDKTGMVVEATYANGSKKTINDYTVENANNLQVDQTSITIRYGGKSVNQNITVTPNPLVKMQIKKAPNKTKYVVGQDFDKTGMMIEGEYQDGSIQEILDYTVENGTKLTKDQTEVTIKFGLKTVNQEIEVEEKTLVSISVDKSPTKVKYIQNKEELNLTGGTIKLVYNDGETSTIDMTLEEVQVSGFNNENLGKVTIKLTYQTKETTLDVEIIEERKAVNSDMNNPSCKVDKVKAYYFTDYDKKEYILIDLEVDNISKNTSNDKLEYYYYLSTSDSEEDINGWIKVEETQDNNKLIFTIDTRKLSNYNELTEGDHLYLYIKEVAIVGGDQSVSYSKAMEVGNCENIELYIDGELEKNEKRQYSAEEDPEIAPGILPDTGVNTIIIIGICMSIIIGGVLLIRYKNLSKYVK